MPILARETGASAVYLIDELNKTRRHVDGAEYKALQALGWAAAKTVPVGTLTPYPVTTLTVASALTAITAAGDEDAQFTSLVEAAVTASLRQAGLIK